MEISQQSFKKRIEPVHRQILFLEYNMKNSVRVYTYGVIIVKNKLWVQKPIVIKYIFKLNGKLLWSSYTESYYIPQINLGVMHRKLLLSFSTDPK